MALDNKAIAGILYETADLMEIDGDDPFRDVGEDGVDFSSTSQL